MRRKTLFPSLPKRLRSAADRAWSKGGDALEHFEAKVSNPVSLTLLSKTSQRFLRQLRSDSWSDGFLPLSSKDVRAASGQAMIESVIIHAIDDDRLTMGKSRLKLLTIKPDVGLVEIDAHTYPAELTKRTARSYVSGTDVETVMMLDLALFAPGRGRAEHLAHIHVHGIAALLPQKAGERASMRSQVSPKRKSTNKLGNDVVTVTHKGTGAPITLSDDDIAGLGWYISKLTCGVSTIYQGRNGQKSEKSHTDWSFAGSLRQLEFWSYVSVLDSCWAHGEVGRSIRKLWRSSLIERLDLGEVPRKRELNIKKRQRQWARVWADLGNGFKAIDPCSMTATARHEL